MSIFLGIDTSNYTTSVAIYNCSTGEMLQKKKLLPVEAGELGLRQSDAVFAHVKQLGGLLEELCCKYFEDIDGIGVSVRPRDVDGSYMPCFMVGEMAARSVASVLKAPLYTFSHQCGHVAAALFSAGRLELCHEKFLAFHLSGGTTEALLVEPEDDNIIRCSKVAGSLDLKAGQAVDRVGLMLGLGFPAGRELEKLALKSELSYKPKPTLKGSDCCLSGIENRCLDMLEKGAPPEDIAFRCLADIEAALSGMTDALISEYGSLPLVYAGGVMSNTIIRGHIERRFGGIFAAPDYSADNAAGIAVLASMRAVSDAGH